MEMRGRIIKRGVVEAEALVTDEPLSFFGGIDPDTSEVVDAHHELKGQKVRGRILVFPQGKGSTVGSYTIYRLKKNGVAPAGIINKDCETVVAVGAIISDIPCIDQVDISKIKTDDKVKIDGDKVIVGND